MNGMYGINENDSALAARTNVDRVKMRLYSVMVP